MKKNGLRGAGLSLASAGMGFIEFVVFGIPTLFILLAVAFWWFSSVAQFIRDHWIVFSILLGMLVALLGVGIYTSLRSFARVLPSKAEGGELQGTININGATRGREDVCISARA